MKQNIWIFNHYATNMFFDHAGRHYSFAKHLIRAGYNVRIFCASTRHNTNVNLITDNRKHYDDICDEIPFTFIQTRVYVGNGLNRILNMSDYYCNLFSVSKLFDSPDIIIGSSVHPLACVAAIKLSKKYNCKCIVEIRDLWPESIVAYGLASKKNPFIKLLYRLEKWIYKKSDAIIFTMEGGKDYIVDKKWDLDSGGTIDLSKVHHINNGVDLEAFEENRENYILQDSDLDDPSIFKLVYTGSIRRVNCIDLVLDSAKLVKNPSIRFLIWGDGDQLERLKQRVVDEKISNVTFKGRVEKKYVPGIVSRTDVNFFVLENSPLFRFGLSLNKSFDYLAAAKPLLIIGDASYSMIDRYKCGIHLRKVSPQAFAEAVDKLVDMSPDLYNDLCYNARLAAKDYDFKEHTKKLVKIIEYSSRYINRS